MKPTLTSGLRRVQIDTLARECDVSARTARRYLQKHFAARAQGDGAFALTECETLETRRALVKLAPYCATGFTMQKRRG